MERTLVIIKPEAVRKKLVGKIVSIYEDNRLDIIHSHRIKATKDVLAHHYESLKDKEYFPEVLAYMSSSEVVVLILEGLNVVDIVRDDEETWMYDIKTHDPDFIAGNKTFYEKQLNVYSYIYQNLRGNQLDHT
ncbi:MAG: hypothetical protein HGA25_11585, partial [Clostridiales bacterium]|nr:hypothetical protein [Clostridiales bacterium]